MSFLAHAALNHLHVVLLLFIQLVCSGCYSLTGSAIPPHLKTITIDAVQDNSGYGLPIYREVCFVQLQERFRADNNLVLVSRNGDSRLSVILTSIREEPITVRAGERERERKITVVLEVEYNDLVKKKQRFKKAFSQFDVFPVDQASAQRDRAIRTAIQRNVDDILVEVVSGW